MQRETSNDSFLEYGQTYHEPIRLTHPDLIHQHQTAITRRYVSQFYCFNCDTYIEVHDGIGVLLVSHTADAADVQEFAMNRLIHIKPNVYFAVVSTTQKLEFELYAESNYSLHVTDFPSQYEFLAVLPRIEMQKILGYYYRIRTPNYCFKGEQHNFFELTYVDEGELETEVDGTLYQLKDKELMIYGPGQFHTQYTDDSHNASYMTVLFDMRNLTPVEQEVWYDALINRVFHYDQKINSLIKAFVRESTTGIPYMNSLMLCLLTEIIIRLLQGTYDVPFILDASGPLLLNGMEASPVLIKPNEEEYYATFGVHPSVTQEFCASYRQILMEHNIAYGAVSLGEKGALLVTPEAAWYSEPVSVDVKGVQGAGDSMVSGFAYAIAEQHTQGDQLLKMAVSCAHASLELPGTQMCTMAGVEKRFPLTPVKRLCTF